MHTFSNIKKVLAVIVLLLAMTADDRLLATELVIDEVEAVTVSDQSSPWVFNQEVDQRNFSADSLQAFREKAIYAAKNNDLKSAHLYAEKYIQYSGETSFLDYSYFKPFSSTKEFTELRDKYSLDFSWMSFFYLFSSIIGFFIAIVLMLRKNQDRWSSVLISLFMLINSVFIFHNFLYETNLVFTAPHMLYVSATYAYIYGPLMYFYYKRITSNYQFGKKDLLHLIPTVAILVLLAPILALSGVEKTHIQFGVGVVDREPYRYYVVFTKFLSLLIYGGMVMYCYIKNSKKLAITLHAKKWIRNLVILTSIYVIAYLIHGLNITGLVPRMDIFVSIQVISMCLTILYIGYASYTRPNLITSGFVKKKQKYTKSGLTPSYSIELKMELLQLLEEEKIYRQNDISLAIVAEKLGTTRHNASQVINEHFALNFFELINKYRIDEAKEILKSDKNKNLNIIDVAYEVGFNNKVTFNKSFRKQLSITPSQYISSLQV
ncbi:helix-turn-helix transcriptional regulator [Aureisphaera galaxeae]|uniref:helix-turn-helix domain-containing protein n=1 Tax=Aureisphaera galaxeae TaxID=1538023 RepID=UPI002351002F|nr:helix-turn-helix transcriptional regulator [Aureisphaera galaxeae]MDC8006245.1 helix-turn-helix transcriptional regulator [Aureisphaera galaxeae]